MLVTTGMKENVEIRKCNFFNLNMKYVLFFKFIYVNKKYAQQMPQSFSYVHC